MEYGGRCIDIDFCRHIVSSLSLPEKELRLELLFLTNALTAILGIIATVNGRTAVTGVSEVDWGALTGLIIMLAGGGLIGLVIYKYRRIKTNI